MFVRVISDFAPLFLKFCTTLTVAFANKSSDKLEARDAETKKHVKFNFLFQIFNKVSHGSINFVNSFRPELQISTRSILY